ncbi:hypothetical protein ACFL1B_04430 [Nanoarchaeota archaeon]
MDLRQEIKDMSEAIEDKFDEKLERLKLPEPSIDPRIARIKEKYLELRGHISDARKSGKDVFAAEFTLKAFPARLKMAEATQDDDDIRKAESVLNDGEKELQEALSAKLINVKKEVEELSNVRKKEEIA